MANGTYIHNLDDDALLQVFSYYRLEEEDNWNLRLKWRKLAHVCHRWRHLVFDSSSLLDMSLRLTNKSPSIHTLCHLPSLPLVIDYSHKPSMGRAQARKDEANIYFGLQQHGRVCQVALQAPSSSLRILLEPMSKPFPRLGGLSLSSTTTEGLSPVLPETLRAPFLRRLSLHGIGLPKGLSLLSSMICLSTLSLTNLSNSCYFSPGHLVTQLQGLYCLEELSISFAIPLPLPSGEEQLLPTPIPPVTLPALRRVTFRGVGVYLDNFVAQINTPLLEQLSLTLFFELAFALVNLSEFIRRTEKFRRIIARVIFNKEGVSIDVDHYEQRVIGKSSLYVYVNCETFDWQIDSATQVCRSLGNVLSAVVELTLDLDADAMPSFWEILTLDSTVWLELLLPFTGVKKLHIGLSLTLELSQALESIPGELVLEILPELRELEVQLEFDHAIKVFSAFVEIREFLGRPVHLSASPILHSEPEVPLEFYYMDTFGQQYQYRATQLISKYRSVIKAHEEAGHSYVLRSLYQVVDDALKSATEAQMKASNEANEKFKKAIDALSAFEMKYDVDATVARTSIAEATDECSVTILKTWRWPERLPVTFTLPHINPDLYLPVQEDSPKSVKFLIYKSLVDNSPIIMRLEPGSYWRLLHFLRPSESSRYKDLKPNFHFYATLPTKPEEYRGNSRVDPIKTFSGHKRISVLADNPDNSGQVFVDTAWQKRAFVNIYVLNDTNHTIIFKDVRGRLEGESIVGATIHCIPNLWCIEESLSLTTSQPALSPNWNSPSLTVTQITSATGKRIRDWREPIRRMLQSQDVGILFTDKQPSSSSSIYSTASGSGVSSL